MRRLVLGGASRLEGTVSELFELEGSVAELWCWESVHWGEAPAMRSSLRSALLSARGVMGLTIHLVSFSSAPSWRRR